MEIMKTFLTKTLLVCVCAMFTVSAIFAKDIPVTKFQCAGPFPVFKPLELDSINLNQKSFTEKDLLETSVDFDLTAHGKILDDSIAPGIDMGYALYILRFNAQNISFAKAKVNISGLADYQLFVDGKKSDGKNVELVPGSHVFDIKYLSKGGRQEKVKVSLSGVSGESILLSTGAKRLFSMKEVLEGERLSGVSLSHDGRFLITRYSGFYQGEQHLGNTN